MDKGILGFKERAGLLADMPSTLPSHFSTRPHPEFPHSPHTEIREEQNWMTDIHTDAKSKKMKPAR